MRVRKRIATAGEGTNSRMSELESSRPSQAVRFPIPLIAPPEEDDHQQGDGRDACNRHAPAQADHRGSSLHGEGGGFARGV